MTDPTEGPWKVARQARNRSSFSIQARGGTRICACRYNWRQPNAWKEAEANAELLATAGTAAQAAKNLGFDPIGAVEALPKLLTTLSRALVFIEERGYQVDYRTALDAARTRKE